MPSNTEWKNYVLGTTKLDNDTRLSVLAVRSPSGRLFLRVKLGDKRYNLALDHLNVLRLAKEIKKVLELV